MESNSASTQVSDLSPEGLNGHNGSKPQGNKDLTNFITNGTNIGSLPPLPKPSYQMVPFSLLIKRHVEGMNSDLQRLIVYLPSQTPENRSSELLNFTLKYKKQTARILAAIKFAENMGKIKQAQGLIAFFHQENAKISQVCSNLSGTYSTFANARVGLYDMHTALDVFESGSYKGFPEVVEERLVAPPRLTESEVKPTMSLLTDIIFMRYLKVEFIPKDLMHNVRIENGKLYLKKQNEYEVCLTLLGTDEKLPWHLVFIKTFVKGHDIYGYNDPTKLMDPRQYRYFAYQAQQKLLPDHLKDNPNSNPDGKDESTPVKLEPKYQKIIDAGRTPYISYLHDYLHKYCISLQFEILFSQAFKLSTSRWHEQLKVEVDQHHTELKLHYWNKEEPIAFIKATKLDSSQYVSIERIVENDSCLKISWHGALVKALLKSLTPDQLSKVSNREKEFIIIPTNLDVEKVLLQVIKVNIKLILIKFQSLILSLKVDNPSLFAKILTEADVVIQDAQIPYLIIKYSSHRSLKLIINSRNGRANIYVVIDRGEEIRVLELEKSINKSPNNIGEILLNWRLSKVVDDIQFMAGYHGLSSSHALNIDPIDKVKFGSNIKKLIYLYLPEVKDRYIVIGFIENKLRFFYIGVEQKKFFFYLTFMIPLNQNLKRFFQKTSFVDQTEHIVRYKQGSDKTSNDLMGILIELSRGYFLTTNIGSQLKSLSIKKFTSLPPFPSKQEGEGQTSLAVCVPVPPCLSKNSSDKHPVQESNSLNRVLQIYSIFCEDFNSALNLSSGFTKGFISVFVPSSYSSWVAFTCEIDIEASKIYANLPSNEWIKLETVDFTHEGKAFKRAFLTFIYKNFQTCFENFCDDWKSFIYASNFLVELSSINLARFNMKIKSFGLDSVTLSYNDNYLLSIGWGCQDNYLFGSGRFKLRLLLDSEDPSNIRNPHIRIQSHLENFFNQTQSLYKLLNMIFITSPVLVSLDAYERRMVRSVNIIPKSCTNLRLIYSQSNAIELFILSPSKVKIIDGSINVDGNRLPPAPWIPKPHSGNKEGNKKADGNERAEGEINRNSNSSKPNTLQVHPISISYFELFPSFIPNIIKKRKNMLVSDAFDHDKNWMVCEIYLITEVLKALDWIFIVYTVFQVINYLNRKTPGPLKNLSRQEDFVYEYNTETASWTLKAANHLNELVYEPTQIKSHNGSELSLDDLKIFSSFLTNKINVGGNQTISNFHSSYAATFLPSDLLADFVKCIKQIEEQRDSDDNFDWHLSVPPNINHPFPKSLKSNAQAFVLNQSPEVLKALFSVKRKDNEKVHTLFLPLIYKVDTKTLHISSSLSGEKFHKSEDVKFDAIEEILIRFNNQSSKDDQKFSTILQKFISMPLEEFIKLIPAVN